MSTPQTCFITCATSECWRWCSCTFQLKCQWYKCRLDQWTSRPYFCFPDSTTKTVRHFELSELFWLRACQCFLPSHRVISVETRIFWHGLGRSDKVWLLRPAQPARQQTEGLVKKPRRQTWVAWRWYIAPSASVALLFHYFQVWRGSCLPHSLKHNMKDHRFQPRAFLFTSTSLLS